MKPEDVKKMNEINWWHRMILDSCVTKGKDNTQVKLQLIQMPEDLTGKKVIDIGAWDGFFSFEAERRGAKEVLAIDTITWQSRKLWDVNHNCKMPHTGKDGFNFAHRILDSNVESDECEVMDLKSEDYGKWDLVLCLGIMYHMEDPFGMCKVCYDLCADGGMCILETHMDLQELERPAMAFYPNKECNNDPGTWCGPNPACVKAMLKAAGFESVKMVHSDKYNRGVFHAWKKK